MAVKLKIKKGDGVKVITGNDKDRIGKVLTVHPKVLKVIVEGCKVAKKTIRPSEKNSNSGFISKKTLVDISNVTETQK